jgi:hypothetical protein
MMFTRGDIDFVKRWGAWTGIGLPVWRSVVARFPRIVSSTAGLVGHPAEASSEDVRHIDLCRRSDAAVCGAGLENPWPICAA